MPTRMSESRMVALEISVSLVGGGAGWTARPMVPSTDELTDRALCAYVLVTAVQGVIDILNREIHEDRLVHIGSLTPPEVPDVLRQATEVIDEADSRRIIAALIAYNRDTPDKT